VYLWAASFLARTDLSAYAKGMSTISAKLIRDLAEAGDDFGFEMRIGKILRALPSAQVTHGGLYHPLGFNQPQRQYDYRVKIVNGKRIIRLAVECKNFFVGSPVVLCGASRLASESRLDNIVSDVRIVVPRHGDADQKVVGILLKNAPSELYPVGEFVGKAVIRPDPGASREKELVPGTKYRLTGDGDVWEKWNQAVSHAAVLARASADERQRQQTFTLTAALPLVVVPEDALWTISYDADGRIEDDPKRVPSTTLYVGSEHVVADYVQPQLSHIHLMTPSGLNHFVSRLVEPESEVWEKIVPSLVVTNYERNRNQPIRRD
jgi:hypothetical protein